MHPRTYRTGQNGNLFPIMLIDVCFQQSRITAGCRYVIEPCRKNSAILAEKIGRFDVICEFLLEFS